MAVYKRGDIYWYDFRFKGRRYQESTKIGNIKAARAIEAAKKTALAKGEVGLIERPPVPTFKEFAPRFEQAIETLCKGKPATVKFYKERMMRLKDYSPLLSARLNEIDEEFIELLKQRRTRTLSRLGKPLSIIYRIDQSRVGNFKAVTAFSP